MGQLDDKRIAGSKSGAVAKPPADTPEATAPKTADADLKRGVERQRKHIEGLTGEDPLRGGVAD